MPRRRLRPDILSRRANVEQSCFMIVRQELLTSGPWQFLANPYSRTRRFRCQKITIQLQLANFVEIENVTTHIETMSRFQIVIGIAMIIAVLLVFAHPATFGLPTPPP